MSAEPFVDTNLWVYAHLETPDDPKGDRARALLESMSRPEARKQPPKAPAAQPDPNRTEAEAHFHTRAKRGQGQSERGLELLNKALGDDLPH